MWDEAHEEGRLSTLYQLKSQPHYNTLLQLSFSETTFYLFEAREIDFCQRKIM